MDCALVNPHEMATIPNLIDLDAELASHPLASESETETSSVIFGGCQEDLDFECLPNEIKVKIFKYLSVRELLQIALVSRSWYKLAFDGELWGTIDVCPFYKQLHRITGDQLAALSCVAGGFLREANFRGCSQLSSRNVRQIADNCHNILYLNLSGCRTPSVASLVYFLRRVPYLRTLNLSGLSNVNKCTLHVLSQNCQLLERLNLAGCEHVNEAGLDAVLENCTQLRWLKLDGCKGGRLNETMKLIECLKNLEHLSLGGCQISDEGVETLVKCKQLRHLNLAGCTQMTDKAMEHIGKLRLLEQLSLSGCSRLTDAGIVHLSSLTRLTDLDLEECESITDRSLHAISKLPLRTLYLSFCMNITDLGVSSLFSNPLVLDNEKSFPQLSHIALDNCPLLTDASVRIIVDYVRRYFRRDNKRFFLDLFDCSGVTRFAFNDAKLRCPQLVFKGDFWWCQSDEEGEFGTYDGSGRRRRVRDHGRGRANGMQISRRRRRGHLSIPEVDRNEAHPGRWHRIGERARRFRRALGNQCSIM
ncbi:uncharacterized protein VTP21DRAFT_6439 [Calcarisporiella thermophila]|uniref:uncharacterized protein n=1 Tax=Calcarisporiella thermophila TaxID=911321 RepID=UPI003744047C